MLEDREYMRQPSFEPRRLMTIGILVVNVLAYLAQLISYRAFPAVSLGEMPPTDAVLALSMDGLRHGYVWQLITFQFMHGSILHLLLNSWGIYVFGRAVEDAIGGARWLQLYLVSGVIGGLVQLGCSYMLPHFFGTAGLVGASAGLYGLIGVFATLFPHQRLTLLLFFVLPITLTARMLVVLSAVIAVLGLVLGGDGIAHAAHLGGMAAGILLIRMMLNGRWPKVDKLTRGNAPPQFVKVAVHKAGGWHSLTPKSKPDELPPAEYISKEVDPILDKISAYGIQSLTERERKILDAARKKMYKN